MNFCAVESNLKKSHIERFSFVYSSSDGTEAIEELFVFSYCLISFLSGQLNLFH